MHGDFSRLTFRPGKGYAAVLAQQGRVQLDADANEQALIQLHLARTLAADMIGRHGGPGDGFRVEYRGADGDEPPTLDIHGGRYYVGGVMVDSTRPPALVPVRDDGGGDDGEAPTDGDGEGGRWGYWDQPFAHLDPDDPHHRLPDPAQGGFVVYLKLWDQLVTAVEDPDIRESGLGATLPDTCARSRTTWQVLAAVPELGEGETPPQGAAAAFDRWAAEQTGGVRTLAARSQRPERVEDDPCTLPPDAPYRGHENQLYRVEVHHGGAAADATFKWSRDNGSVVFPVRSLAGAWVTLAALGRDDKLDLHVGDWVEVVDDASAAHVGLPGPGGEPRQPAPLLRVEEVDVPERRVRLSGEPPEGLCRDPARHPLLRRWDHRQPRGRGAPRLRDGALPVVEGRWLDLEDGVQVWFGAGGDYRSGDHWAVPARTLTGDVEWPRDAGGRPLLAPPAGVHRHYAPLAWVDADNQTHDLRHVFTPLTADGGVS